LFAGDIFSEAPLPQPAMGLSRRRMDTLLLDRAEQAGAGVERGVTVRDWSDGALTISDGGTLRPKTVFLATGKHDLRGLGRPREEHQTIGIRVKLTPGAALERLVCGAIELHLFDEGYCGLVLQEGGRGNLCLAVRKSRLVAAGSDPVRLLQQWADESPRFAERVALVESEPDAIGAVPYGWIARETTTGLFRLGDQSAVIPSLAGEGNGIALASGIIAAKAWSRGDTAQGYQLRMAAAAKRPVWLARQLWRLCEEPKRARLVTRLVGITPWLAGHLAGQTRIRH
jgi:menaquinone-9 beta-reductase